MSIPPLISTRPRTAFDRISLYFQTYIYIIRPDAKLFLPFRSNLINRPDILDCLSNLFSSFLKCQRIVHLFFHSVLFISISESLLRIPFVSRTKTEYFSNESFQQFFQSPIIVEISGNLARRKWSNFISDRQRFRRLSPQREGDRR